MKRAEVMPSGLRERLRALHPGAEVVAVEPLGPDRPAAGPTVARKAAGYGRPLKVTLALADGGRRSVVFHTAQSDPLGHDRRADRAAELLLAFDTYGQIPGHVRALDVGALEDGGLRSLSRAGEIYLITEWAEGVPYALDLRRMAETGEAGVLDRERGRLLARYLAGLHRPIAGPPDAYRRAVRDLVGHGEGIYGIVDAYPARTPAASPERLARLEAACASWRWRLRGREDRLCPTHGDFHPFNLLFAPEATRPTLLDASRGCLGDAADDVTALAVNYLLFPLGRPQAWRGAFRALWHGLFETYLQQTGDRALLEVAPPWFAWRALVVCCPRFYPDLTAAGRDQLLSLAERFLAQGRLDPEQAEELFR